MKQEEFAEYFKILDKASDRLRSVIYVFIIVYVAMLLYGLTAFLYPAGQYALDDAAQKMRCAYTKFPGDACQSINDDLAAQEPGTQLRPDIELNIKEHELQSLYDNSVKTRTFAFPIFGLETDRDLLWVLFPLVGIIGYYIVMLTLGSAIRLFIFMKDRNTDSAFRLRMIQSTLVITVPLEKDAELFGRFDRVLKPLWRALALGVFLIPIIVSVLMVINQTNVIPVWYSHVNGEVILKDATGWFKAELSLEAILIAIEAVLFTALVQMGSSFGACQTEIARLISKADEADEAEQKNSKNGPFSLAAE